MAKKKAARKRASRKRTSELDSADGVRVGEEPVPGMRLRCICRGHQGTIGRIAWSPCGRFIASPSSDKTIRIWDANDGKCLEVLEGHTHEVTCVAWRPSRTSSDLASGSIDRTIRIWDVGRAQTRYLIDNTDEGTVGWFRSVVWLSNDVIAGGTGGSSLKLWRVESGTPQTKREMFGSGGVAVATPIKSTVICAAGYQDSAYLWDWSRQDETFSFETLGEEIRDVTYSFDDKYIAIGCSNSTIEIWETHSRKRVSTVEGHTQGVSRLAFSKDGLLLASKSADGTVRIWRCDDWSEVASIEESYRGRNHVTGLAFHPTSHRLATLSNNGQHLRLWDYDVELLLGVTAPTERVSYTSAKIVLVGESNVGKSCLAMRLAEDRYPDDHEHGTTHGMRFWPMEATTLHPSAKPPDGQRRDVVLWDFGGQDEYRLVHQMFLHDTTLALVLIDPTRGRAAMDEARDWNKRLEKHLGASGRNNGAVKLLVGAKVDSKVTSELIQSASFRAFCKEHGFADFIETSALKDLGIEQLREQLSKTIDWDHLAKTSRPELFQHIRDDIESRRKTGEIVLTLNDFKESIKQAYAEIYDEASVDAVTDQLAQQGLIVRSRRFDETEVLVLQLPVIEQYAGSLIVSARNSLQGVPAIEQEKLADPNVDLPGLGTQRLKDRGQERVVLECVTELLIQHGICFRHEGLLIFPACFRATESTIEDDEAIGVSLYYDFSGAIDNVYASLISWLVIGKEFGNVRLWQNRVEFDVPNKATCGLRKVDQGGGFAHLDVYFLKDTDVETKKEFISFVHQHLRKNGISVVENFELLCSNCRYAFPRSVVQNRMRQLEDDVVCPQCETRNPLTQGISEKPESDSEVEQKTFALVTQVEKQIAEEIGAIKAHVFSRSDEDFDTDDPIRVLHLSDLHFTADINPETKLTWLINDLTQGEHLGFERLDYLVISGDMADKASVAGFENAREFVSQLTKRFNLTPKRCILVPGNHDVQRLDEAFQFRSSPSTKELEIAVKQGNIYLVPGERYNERLQMFSDKFFHPIMQKPYPLDPTNQGMVSTFVETGLQFLMFNSCWNLDQFNETRASINPDSLAAVTEKANEDIRVACRNDDLSADDFLRIAVWHHPVYDRHRGLDNLDFVSHFQQIGVSLCLTGDVHELKREHVRHWEEKRIEVLGAGSFAALRDDLPDSTPRSYNLFEIERDRSSIRTHTRKQTRPDRAWEGWYEWNDPDGKGKLPYFDIPLK